MESIGISVVHEIHAEVGLEIDPFRDIGPGICGSDGLQLSGHPVVVLGYHGRIVDIVPVVRTFVWIGKQGGEPRVAPVVAARTGLRIGESGIAVAGRGFQPEVEPVGNLVVDVESDRIAVELGLLEDTFLRKI